MNKIFFPVLRHICGEKQKVFFDDNLSPVSSTLLAGIVFGGNQGMPQKFLQELRSVGEIHVIAASGMNVTFVASALIGILVLFLKDK